MAEGTSALGLNEHHQVTTVNYMRFARYQRGQRLRSVDACFDDLKSSRLFEDTYTVDEVTEMLDGLLSVVKSEVGDELINTAHTNVLLLRQLFQQAEKWHLKLQADISELENRELLEKIADFEEAEFSGAKRDTDFSHSKNSKLDPLNESGSSALLSMKIADLEQEKNKLSSRLGAAEERIVGATAEKTELAAVLRQKEELLNMAMNKKGGYDQDEVNLLQSQMSQLRATMEGEISNVSARASHLESNLTDTKHELLKVQETLELAEKELEKKVSQTAPFKNLKQMLQKKNDQLKDLRRRLGKYEDLDE